MEYLRICYTLKGEKGITHTREYLGNCLSIHFRGSKIEVINDNKKFDEVETKNIKDFSIYNY